MDDTEPKFGLAVTGVIDPQRVLTNANAKPGDALILTKPIGLGIITTAIKRGLADQPTIDQAIAIMSTLNKTAAEVLDRFQPSACTDITGFGLLGHLRELVHASAVDAVVFADQVPILEQAKAFVTAGVVPGGTLNNLEFVVESVDWPPDISRTVKTILCDAQTSGGLLISAPAAMADGLLAELTARGVTDAAIIGTIAADGEGKIQVRHQA